MRVAAIDLIGWKKHRKAYFAFDEGSVTIQGKSYAGKSSILQAILVGMWGSYAVSAPLKTMVSDGMKDFLIKLVLVSNTEGKSVTVTRSIRDASITRAGEEEPYVRGHTPVNAEIARLAELDRDTFRKVFTSEQGSPQQLLQMEGAELNRFIEAVSGLDKLDEMQRKANSEVTVYAALAGAEAMNILCPEEYTAHAEKLSKLETELNALDVQINTITLKEKELGQTKSELVTQLDQGRQDNAAATKWLSERESLVAQLGNLSPYKEVEDTQEREQELFKKTQISKELQNDLAQYVALNQSLELYENSYKSWSDELNGIEPVEAVPEETIAGLRTKITQLTSFIKFQEDAAKDYEHALGLLQTATSTQERLQKESVALGLLKDVPDRAPAIAKAEEFADKMASLSTQLEAKRSALHESICPTCKRAFEVEFSVEELKDEIDTLEIQKQAATTAYFKAKEAQKEVEAAYTEAREHNLKVESLRTRVEEATKDAIAYTNFYNEAKAKIADKFEIDNARNGMEKTQKELNAAEEQNRSAKAALTRQEYLRAKLADLEKPKGEKVGLVPYQERIQQVAKDISDTSMELTRIQTENTAIRENNSKRLVLSQKLEDYPESEAPEVIDLSPLTKLFNGVEEELHELTASYRALSNEQHVVDSELKAAKVLLDRHNEAHERSKAATSKQELYRFLSTLLANSRVGFLAKAQATIFQVASDFAQMSTGGDISEVLIHEGGISYVEGGITRPKSCASGAQKSVIGLGMKLGVANLITSDFDTLILDEVSADMDPETSFGCMSALNTLFPNAITVSHRDMDTAGQVIRVG